MCATSSARVRAGKRAAQVAEGQPQTPAPASSKVAEGKIVTTPDTASQSDAPSRAQRGGLGGDFDLRSNATFCGQLDFRGSKCCKLERSAVLKGVLCPH